MGHYVAFVKDPRGGWFKMDDHKTSPVSLSEVLKVQAYMLFYIHKVPMDTGTATVKKTEQVSESMDENGTPDAVGIPSKTRTEPKQIASHSAPTLEEPAEGLTPSHAVALIINDATSCKLLEGTRPGRSSNWSREFRLQRL
jgi:hypothetical protein